jgi:glycosyl hydrolase family 99
MTTLPTRRQFLAASLRAGLALPALQTLEGVAAAAARPAFPPPEPLLAARFRDLRRHFIFEYYPWYGGPPGYLHWDFWNRDPPLDLSSRYVPRLGAYDVRDKAVLEQHARWISDAGVGAIALSWWGRGSDEDANVRYVMDVMKDHDVKVTFALEPYTDDRGRRYASDILYLLREYGDKRGWDAFLVLKNADGTEGPVFKGFRCILPRETTDCHGVTSPVDDYTPDSVWRAQTDALRDELRRDFHHVTLLADSLEFARTPASGFDGIGIYDNYLGPETYAGFARGASQAGLVFSFNVNPGFDGIEPRYIDPRGCYVRPAFAPSTAAFDWSRADERERAALASQERIADSFAETVRVQTDPGLTNAKRGFFLVYVNSFNEWHEGHAFEPMKDAADLTPEERALGYHNPARGDYRLATLGRLVNGLLEARDEPFDPMASGRLSWPM